MKNLNLNTIINLRGYREQSFKFATNKFKGGMKGCFTKGCEIFTPLSYAITNIDVTDAMRYQQAFVGETQINECPTFIK